MVMPRTTARQTKKFMDIIRNIMINLSKYPKRKVPALSIGELSLVANRSR